VRSPSAPFEIRQEPEDLLASLVAFYIQTLESKGENVADTDALSELLYGDKKHIESIVTVLDGTDEVSA
jgi:hypothetical protein